MQFFLDLVATADNIGLLYHIAMKAKTVRDAESHVYSEVDHPDHCIWLQPTHNDLLEPVCLC